MRKIPMIIAALGAIVGLAIRRRRRHQKAAAEDQHGDIPGQFMHPQDAP
jgi:hypothetical protein